MGSSLSWESSFRHETDDWRVENISRSVSYRQLDEVIAVAHWTRTNKLGFTTKHTGDCRLLIVNADNMIEEKNQPFEDHFIDFNCWKTTAWWSSLRATTSHCLS